MPARNAPPAARHLRRWAGWLWYRGERFCGFQRQVDAASVQEAVERALAEVGAPTTVVGAGRTDRGVHARMQVVACRLPGDAGDDTIARVRDALPDGIGLSLLRPAPPRFHPQWSACGKTYRYRIHLGAAARPGTWCPALEPRLGRAPDPDRLVALLRRCVGTRDFGAFHPRSSPRRPRTVTRCEARLESTGLLDVTLEGDGFARHQVRYLVGSAAATAVGALSEGEWDAALEAATPIPGVRASGDGLVLWEVHYPPALDPFTPAERALAPGVPAVFPFIP